jgi:hypothetical protein
MRGREKGEGGKKTGEVRVLAYATGQMAGL